MSWIRRIGNFLRSDTHSMELDREIEFHIRERADDLVAAGMTHGEALAEARRRFGNRGAQKERARDADLFPTLDSIRGDIRYAARSLAATPLFTIIAVASLALGIGANTAIFSLIDALLLKSLPVVEPNELIRVTLGEKNPTVTNPIWEQLRDRQTVFSHMLAVSKLRSDLSSTGVERPVSGSWVSGDYFATLGVHPAAGRLINTADDYRGCPGVVVLGHAFWKSEFGGDVGVVGRSLMLEGHPFRIVGVAEPRFFGLTVGETQQVYATLCGMDLMQPGTLDYRRNWYLSIIGRPKPGVTTAQVSASLRALSPSIMEATLPVKITELDRQDHLARRMETAPAGMGLSYLRGIYGKALYVLAAIVAIVLLVACANVANLLLARGAARRREVAVRLAIGASRIRLARQLIIESLVLAFAGAALGIAIATWGGRVLVGIMSQDLPVSLDLSPNWRILGFACGIAVLTVMFFGVVPAFRETAVDPQEALKSGGRGLSASHRGFGLGKALVASQLALALVIIVSAGLLLGTFRRLGTEDPGFRADGILLVSTSLYGAKVPRDQKAGIQARFAEALSTLPSVTAVTSMNMTPIGGSYMTNNAVVRDPSGATIDKEAYFNDVGAGYFSTLGMRLIAGREFTADDRKGSAPVAIVNRAAARLLFGGRNPIGLSYQTKEGPTEMSPPVTIVGVASDAKYSSLRQEPPATVYRPIAQTSAISAATYAIRGTASQAALIAAATAAATAIEPTMRLSFESLSDQVAHSLTREQLLAVLSAFFGGLTLLLATIGVYGIMAYGVNRRRNEFGIRIAVGATPVQVIRLVSGEMARVLAAGLVIGGLIAMASTRVLRTFLYGVEPTDPAAFAGAIVILGVVAVCATLAPALRASRVDPVRALREE